MQSRDGSICGDVWNNHIFPRLRDRDILSMRRTCKTMLVALSDRKIKAVIESEAKLKSDITLRIKIKKLVIRIPENKAIDPFLVYKVVSKTKPKKLVLACKMRCTSGWDMDKKIKTRHHGVLDIVHDLNDTTDQYPLLGWMFSNIRSYSNISKIIQLPMKGRFIDTSGFGINPVFRNVSKLSLCNIGDYRGFCEKIQKITQLNELIIHTSSENSFVGLDNPYFFYGIERGLQVILENTTARRITFVITGPSYERDRVNSLDLTIPQDSKVRELIIQVATLGHTEPIFQCGRIVICMKNESLDFLHLSGSIKMIVFGTGSNTITQLILDSPKIAGVESVKVIRYLDLVSYYPMRSIANLVEKNGFIHNSRELIGTSTILDAIFVSIHEGLEIPNKICDRGSEVRRQIMQRYYGTITHMVDGQQTLIKASELTYDTL
jgi:hypothetical protein